MVPRKNGEYTKKLRFSQEVYSPSHTGTAQHFQNYPGFQALYHVLNVIELVKDKETKFWGHISFFSI